MSDALPFSPAAERNKASILAVLQTVLPAQGRALEIASGTGQHVVWFAAHLSGWQWQPSDATPHSLPTIAARTQAAGLSNVLPPRRLDVLAEPWFPADTPAFDVTVDATFDATFDAIHCANMLHIAPWATCDALMRLAARHLSPTGQLITYGPYLEDEVPTAPGNLAFDASLRAQDPAWGIRRREDVAQVAERAGLRLAQRHAMPANNLLLVWQRAP